MENKNNIEISMAEMKKDISYIKKALERNDADHREIKNAFANSLAEIKELFKQSDQKYVSRIEFKPVRSIVYGMVGFILISVLGAIIGVVILK